MPAVNCKVLDRGATTVARVHDLRDAETQEILPFKFSPNEWVVVPFGYALSLVGNPAFAVHTEDGQPLATRAPKELTQTARGFVMMPDQVIAKLGELTTEALIARVAAAPGGDTLGKRPSREGAIRFLLAAPDASPPPSDAPPARRHDTKARETFVQDGVTEVSV